MSETISKHGSCLCGAVRFFCENILKNVSACHCTNCKKWTGGPYFAVKCGTNITIEGDENITLFESSDWAVRGFCKVCGSNLFYKFKHNNEYRLSLGLFDDEDNLFLEHQYFVDMKSDVYTLKNRTKDFTTEEVFAMLKKKKS